MISVRHHAGTISDSMKTLAEVSNNQQLLDYFNLDSSNLVQIELYSDRRDERTGWERTYLVTVGCLDGSLPVGFASGPLEI